MSSMESKIEVITEFLKNRAALGRVTNVREIQMVAGELLAVGGHRLNGSCAPVDREKVHEALDAIATASFADQGVLLPAIVVHFWDDEPGARFTRWAAEVNLIDPDAPEDPAAVAELATDQRAKVFQTYAASTV